MIKREWSYKIIIRYSLIQLPGIGLVIGVLFLIQKWISLSLWLILVISMVWVAKDIILFFFTWHAYDWEQRDSMVGIYGIALERFDSSGHIWIRGELWKARIIGKRTIEKGQKVQVYGRKGLLLLVQPANEHAENNTY